MLGILGLVPPLTSSAHWSYGLGGPVGQQHLLAVCGRAARPPAALLTLPANSLVILPRRVCFDGEIDFVVLLLFPYL